MAIEFTAQPILPIMEVSFLLYIYNLTYKTYYLGVICGFSCVIKNLSNNNFLEII